MTESRQIRGTRVERFPPLRRSRWDFNAVADGNAYLLRRGEDFEIRVDSLAAAARRWAREHGYELTTRSEFDEDASERPKVGLYVRFQPSRSTQPKASRSLQHKSAQ
ncbi:MAG: hypothetical protein M3065_14595 [Actinomycetota bacterium]|nr:hypothetical protein [Actinomycetota bacterium]